MNQCIKVILNKCLPIEQSNIKNINKPHLELNINTAKELIREANLSACRACNKSSSMWRDYRFNNRFEAEAEYNNLTQEYIESRIEDEYKKTDKKGKRQIKTK